MVISARGRLRQGIYVAFVAGAIGGGLQAAPALAQQGNATQLQGIEVTGSHIRRVDAETADPIISLGHQFIQSTGATTLGELITKLPNISGGSETTAVNNGGTGETTPGLRGLTAARTLMLLDGRRLLLTNLDAIPVNMIDHIEIVKDGASAVYGTDAIGGVVNIITRKHFTGFEATVDGGISEHGDGVKQQYTGTWGLSSDKGHVIAGVSYQNQDAISTAKRKYSKFFLYQGYDGVQLQGGSGTGINGRYKVPSSTVPQLNGCGSAGASSVTVARTNPDANKPTTADFHCYGTDPNDHFNYNLYNYDQLPEQRTEIFMQGDWKVFDNISFFTQALYHNQNARTQLAPEPLVLDQEQPAIPISKDNYYNPFGVDLKSTARLRLASAGDRFSAFDTNDYNISSGFKGTLLDRFDWDLSATYQRETLLTTNHGQVFLPFLTAAVGPSIDQNTCGTPGHVVAGCVPFNMFGTPTAEAASTLFPLDYTNLEKHQTLVDADINGDLFKWWGGTVAGALGYEYRAVSLDNEPDYNIANNFVTDFANKPTKGAFSDNEAYAEISVPLISNMPGAYSLTLNIGERFSDYSTFGRKYDGKYGLEYRPVQDLLLRASYANIFRTPTITDLFGGTAVNAAPTKDPCDGLAAGSPQASNAFCAGIPVPPAGAKPYADNSDGQFNVNDPSNPKLGPEKGYTTNFGFVYNPSFYKPITINVDFWRYSIREAIATIAFQNSLDGCYAGITSFCSNVTRDPATGDINSGVEPIANVGRLLTTGIDFGVKFDLGKTRFGKFSAALDGTYLDQYRYQITQLSPTKSQAGQFVPGSTADQDGSGNFARLRMLGSLTWSQGPFTATVINRFISNVIEYPGANSNGQGPAAGYCGTQDQSTQFITPDPANGVTGGNVFCARGVGSADYTDLTGSYTMKSIGTEVLVGVNNVFGKNAPLVYSGFNANTDSSTYDQIGRAYFARVKVTFK